MDTLTLRPTLPPIHPPAHHTQCCAITYKNSRILCTFTEVVSLAPAPSKSAGTFDPPFMDPRSSVQTSPCVRHRRPRRDHGPSGSHSHAPRETIHALKGGQHRAQGRPSTRSREAIHAIKGGHAHARGRPSTRSKGVDPRFPREVFHTLQGRLSTRSEGGLPRAPREEEGDPRASGGVIHALQGT